MRKPPLPELERIAKSYNLDLSHDDLTSFRNLMDGVLASYRRLGGSIRIPSSFCGAVGHKPTKGLVPYTGVFPIELTLDHTGPIARTAGDAARLLEVLAGADGLDPRQPAGLRTEEYTKQLTGDARGLRIGIVKEGFGWPNSEPEGAGAYRRIPINAG
jgi:Asp-tRNA(Asn)/Glu-tRNA(Gln) amidotransferase A subunit family amidase